MLKKTGTYMAYAAACMLTLSACSADHSPFIADSDETTKSPIELTVGIVGENAPATKSVVTTDNPYGQSAAAFTTAGTSLYMVIQSEDGSNDNDNYTRTIGFAQTKVTDEKTTVDFATDYIRYWEDGQASNTRASQLSIYAACVPDYSLAASVPSGMTATGTADGTTPWTVGGSMDYSNTWGAGLSSTTIAWPLRSGDDANVAVQTAKFITSQDLCFSNNVSYPTGGTDNRIKFDAVNKKFNSAHLVFYHALTWITFKIKKGEGFESGDAFAFSNSNENIVLKGFNTSGTFDITNGEFKTSDPAIGIETINKLAVGSEDGYNHVLHALMVPGSALTSTATNEVYFTLENNLYHITKAQLATALNEKKLSDNSAALADGSTMRPGVHYIFTMTVGKQKVDKLTAAVAPWEEVTAEEMTPTNARITVSLLDNGDHQTGDPATFDLYRLADVNAGNEINDNYAGYNWNTDYTADKAKLTQTATEGVYAASDPESPYTPWYWPDNKTFYHLRTVKPVNHTVTKDPGGDYIALTGAEHVSAETTYTDVCWGAPFYALTGTDKLYYDPTTNGFALKKDSTTDYQISKAIGPTTNNIIMEMFHMMSEVTINITTTGADKLDNLNSTTVSLSNIYHTAKVLMGNGLVVPTGTQTAVNNTVTLSNASSVTWKYGFVPQSLSEVELTITVNNNQYIIDMDKVLTTAVSNKLIANPYTETGTNTGKYTIDRWYPNYKYTYTFNLTKTGINKITATLADWESVTAGDDNVQIQ